MIYRALDANGDYQIGTFLANSPACVAQAVQTRLALWQGEWFLDTTDGTPYMQDIIGIRTNYDFEIRSRILNTPGVVSIVDYQSSVINRTLSVSGTIDTIYGVTQI
jgi:hypothetical protein